MPDLAETKAQSDVTISAPKIINIDSQHKYIFIVLLPLLKKVIKLMYYRLPVVEQNKV